jgi:hypothetical protein
MTAIWPAGPPKLSAATRTHTQKASRNETPCDGVDRAAASIERSVMGSRLCRDHGRRVPIVAPWSRQSRHQA